MSNIHTRGQFIEFCKLVFKDYQLTNSGSNIQVTCPICKSHKGYGYNKRKLAIETQTHVLHCWVCGYKSKNLLHVLKKYYQDFAERYIEEFSGSIVLLDINGNKEKVYEAIKLPEDFELLVTNSANNEGAINYLKARGVTDIEELWYWRFGVSHASVALQGRIIVPSFDYRGSLNYFSARTMFKNIRPKYFNPECERENIIFNELNINWDEELTIVEGVFDLIKCNNNATCILGSDLTSNYKLFQKILKYKTPIVLGLDPDARAKTLKLAKRFFEFDIPVRIVEYPNGDDVGSMSKNQFNDLLEDAKLFDVNYLLRAKIASICLE